MTSSNKNLDSIFNPGSIAVIGASPKPGKISNIIIESLKASGFPGKIYPVNPRYGNIGPLLCYPSLAEINGEVDLAVFAMPAPGVPQALKQGAGRIKAAVVVSGGFAEAGEPGISLEREIKEFARSEGIRLIGPNCMGLYDTVSRVDTFFVPPERAARPPAGGISIVSQSGSFAVTAMDELAAEGVGVARVVSYGNKADVNEADCLDFLAGDAATTAVALYMESVDDGRRFVEAAARCAAVKPVMAVKVGKGGAAIEAARSHTGAMAGRYEVYRAAFRKAGVIELNGYEEFIAGCKAFGHGRRAEGNRVMIITDGGGIGVGIADACAGMGLEVAPLGGKAAEGLKPFFPSYFSISNPLDLTGSATDNMFAEAVEKTLEGDDYDMAIVAALWGPPALTDELPEAVAQSVAFSKKPVIVCTPGGEYSRDRMNLWRRQRLPVFMSPEDAVRAAAVLSRGAKAGRTEPGQE